MRASQNQDVSSVDRDTGWSSRVPRAGVDVDSDADITEGIDARVCRRQRGNRQGANGIDRPHDVRVRSWNRFRGRSKAMRRRPLASESNRSKEDQADHDNDQNPGNCVCDNDAVPQQRSGAPCRSGIGPLACSAIIMSFPRKYSGTGDLSAAADSAS